MSLRYHIFNQNEWFLANKKRGGSRIVWIKSKNHPFWDGGVGRPQIIYCKTVIWYVCTNIYHKSVATRPISSTKANSTTEGKVLYLCKLRGNLTASEIGLLKFWKLYALHALLPQGLEVPQVADGVMKRQYGCSWGLPWVELQRMIRRSRVKNAWVIVFARPYESETTKNSWICVLKWTNDCAPKLIQNLR